MKKKKRKEIVTEELETKTEAAASFSLGTQQLLAFRLMEDTDETMYITGKAGSGKSYLLRYFVENTAKSVVVVAPTGIAALNVGGQTIHSFFQFDFSVQGIDPEPPMSTKMKMILKLLDVLVIDEVSMVRVDYMDAMDRKLRKANKNNLPFGGKQVIMFGDLYQLPPVVSDGQISRFLEDKYSSIFFFAAPVFIENPIKIFELTKIYRQQDKIFIDIL